MRGTVVKLPEERISKKGNAWSMFLVKDSRGTTYQCLCFGDLAYKTKEISQTGVELIVEGNQEYDAKQDQYKIFVDRWLRPQSGKGNQTNGTNGRGSRLVGRKGPDWIIRTDEQGKVWARKCKEGETPSYE